MSSKITFKTIWHEAGISALVLAAVCSAYFILEASLSGTEAAWAGILKTLAQIAKIAGVIVLMRSYMYRFKQEHPDAQRADVRKLGYVMGLLSGLVLSAVMMAFYMWHPEVISNAIDQVMATPQFSQMMDRNALDAIEKIEGMFPQLVFTSNLIYCAIWAFVLPAILAPKIVSDNPFDEE